MLAQLSLKTTFFFAQQWEDLAAIPLIQDVPEVTAEVS